MGRFGPWVLFLVLAVGSASAEEDYGWLVGVESELALRQPVVLTDDRRLEYPGDYHVDNVSLGLSAAGEIRTGWRPLWVGVRGSLWFGSLSGLWIALPRFNLTARWEMADWLSLGMEAPYNPGFSVLLFQRLSVFFGASDLFGERDHALRSFAVLWRTPF